MIRFFKFFTIVITTALGVSSAYVWYKASKIGLDTNVSLALNQGAAALGITLGWVTGGCGVTLLLLEWIEDHFNKK